MLVASEYYYYHPLVLIIITNYLYNLLHFHFRDRGETDLSAFVTAYDVEQARNLEGEKEITAHIERKKGFDNMEYDGKSSKTKQKDGTLKVMSNVTCVSDGTFLDVFQPKDGCDPTYAEELHKTIKKFEAEQNMVYIGADSTAVNTGIILLISISVSTVLYIIH